MKLLCSAKTIALLLWMSLIRNGHAEDKPPLSVLTTRSDDPKNPLIVLTSPITKPVISEEVKYETTEADITIDADGEVTVFPEKSTQPTRAPQKKKPGLNIRNGPQEYLQAQLLSMPEMWNSSPQLALGSNAAATKLPMPPTLQPWYYPMPVYIPYPIPFMLNYAQSLYKGNSEDQFASKFNKQLAENLIRDSGLNLKNIWKDQNQNKNRPGPNKWRGKWKKATTTTTTTTEATPAITPTEPTK